MRRHHRRAAAAKRHVLAHVPRDRRRCPGRDRRPPGLRPVFSAFSARASNHSFRAYSRARAFTAMILAPGQFLGHRHPVGHIRPIGRLRQRHQLRHLGLQPGFELAGVFPRQRAVPARVGVHLGAQRHASAPRLPGPAAAPRRTALRSGRENAAGTRRWYRGRDDRLARRAAAPFLHRRRQQKPRLPVDRSEIAHDGLHHARANQLIPSNPISRLLGVVGKPFAIDISDSIVERFGETPHQFGSPPSGRAKRHVLAHVPRDRRRCPGRDRSFRAYFCPSPTQPPQQDPLRGLHQRTDDPKCAQSVLQRRRNGS